MMPRLTPFAAPAGGPAWPPTPGPLRALALAVGVLGVLGASLARAQGLSNAQVLQSWQQATGQSLWVKESGQLEFHGSATLDAFSHQVQVPSANPALSALLPGQRARGLLQGDLRSTNASQDTSYVQGSFSSTDDRGLQARYASQVSSFQAGRAGPGYQLAFGDVVAAYSSLSSNLGLRGLVGSKDIDRFSLSGFAGLVGDSWESLANRQPLDGQPARLRYVREVLGVKGEYKLAPQWSGYATAQHFADLLGSAVPVAGTPAQKAGTVSAGARYQSPNAQLALELAHSSGADLLTNTPSSGNALVVDGQVRWNRVLLRAGHHDLQPQFASLAQTVAPGIRETYVGADWQASAQLLWSADLRTADTRLVNGQRSELDTLSNRLNYQLADLPGLSLSLSDLRNSGSDALGAPQRSDLTQLGAAFGNTRWTAQASLGRGSNRNPLSPTTDGKTRQWQASLGRHLNDATLETAANYQLLVQGTLAGQQQAFVNQGTDSRSHSLGLQVTLQTQRWGNLSAQWQRQLSTQPTAAPALSSTLWSLDWARQMSDAWNLKAYARANRRNHGDATLQADERTLGVQAGYKW